MIILPLEIQTGAKSVVLNNSGAVTLALRPDLELSGVVLVLSISFSFKCRIKSSYLLLMACIHYVGSWLVVACRSLFCS